MDELVKLVSQRANVPDSAAQTAIETVLRYLKDTLPASFSRQLDGVLGLHRSRKNTRAKGLGDMLSRP
jgi:hypothetical protein